MYHVSEKGHRRVRETVQWVRRFADYGAKSSSSFMCLAHMDLLNVAR